MKITKLETFYVKPRWLFLKIHTDEGITGLGEPIVEGRSQTVSAAVHEAGRYLIGQDPLRISHHWQTLYRGQFYRGGPVLVSALSGIEQALWDIKGKWLGKPIYELMGGAVREKIRMYGHVGGETFGDYIKSAKASRDSGFTILKTGIPAPLRIVDSQAKIESVISNITGVREAIGKDIDLGIDFHGRSSPAMSILLARELEPLFPVFIEEPVLPENIDALVTVARSTRIPIATGERLFTRWGFREVLEKQAAAILQPDLSHAGGIQECLFIAAIAETYFAALAPHCPLGPIALAACLQLDAMIPNFLAQEHVTLGDGYLKEPFKIIDGYIELPDKPGLGIELDDEEISKKLYDGTWDNPRLIHDDGSVADW